MWTKDSPERNYWLMGFLIISSLSFATRFHKISEPDHVCWDETHFGKMGSWYINRTFFFDVHPPLGKMLIGLSGHLTGYNGTFPFNKPGDKYYDTKYLGMRVFCAFLGAAIPPLAFIATGSLTKKLTAALLGSSLILFDVGMITLTQYILLDPPLLCFIIASFASCVTLQHFKPFSLAWWGCLACTGFFLACSISVKFVGLFIVLTVGTHTGWDLWVLLGDLRLPLWKLQKHFLARALCFILLPIILYICFFYVHLHRLSKSGNGDGFYSSEFQARLEGNSLYTASMPRQLAYGAKISLKNHRTGGAYLHSHFHLYPEGVGARQQQVTTYSHKDENNHWIVKTYDREPFENDTVVLIKDGDLVRLEHFQTNRNLHSHREEAPLTKRHNQVTCYGEKGVGDANDVWRVEVVKGEGPQNEVHTVTTKFRLIHYLSNCALLSHNKQLPKWGFDQMEVTCTPNKRDKNTIWNVEDNWFSKLPSESFERYRPGFIHMFFESHAVMFQGNAGLKPKEGEVTSRPWHWPINLRGQFFSGFEYRIYLLGNPVIWWGNLVLLLIYLVIQTAVFIKEKRRGKKSESHYITSSCRWLFLGWALHYFPFYGMGRVLYFHHYFPALMFSSMLSGVIVDYLIECLVPQKHRTLALVSFLSIIIYTFYIFSPLAYGMQGATSNLPNSTMHGLRWLDSWEF